MNAPDSSAIVQIELRLKGCTKRLHEMAGAVGSAKQIRDFDPDRRKNLLARYVVPHLKAGESAAAAEATARANPAYHVELEKLAEQRESAETAIAQWTAEMASYEAARSLLSMAKMSMQTLEG